MSSDVNEAKTNVQTFLFC